MPKPEIELKECPFCGAGDGWLTKRKLPQQEGHLVNMTLCLSCGSSSPVWNIRGTRHAPDVEELERKAWERGMRDAIAEAASTGISKDEISEDKSKLDCIGAWWSKARASILAAIETTK